MRSVVKLPKVGDSTNSVVILEWFISVGKRVAKDEPMVRVETDKVEMEIPSPVSGTVVELRAQVEDEVETGQPLCVVET